METDPYFYTVAPYARTLLKQSLSEAEIFKQLNNFLAGVNCRTITEEEYEKVLDLAYEEPIFMKTFRRRGELP